MTIDIEVAGGIQSALVRELPLTMSFRVLPPHPDGERFEVSHGDTQYGFVIRGEVGWKSITLSLEPQAFSARMVESLLSNLEGDDAASSAVEELRGYPVSAYILIDEIRQPLVRLQPPREQARTLQFRYEFGPVEFRDPSQQIVPTSISSYIGAFARSARRLLPLDVIDSLIDSGDTLAGIPEGARSTVLVDRYERSKANREACIRYHGVLCKVCGFDFGEEYGEQGRGLIEVHHIVPLSELTYPRPIDPKTDLVPLCANCHLMVHRRTPPYSIEELRSMLGRASGLPGVPRDG